jgi:hypothetical protein
MKRVSSAVLAVLSLLSLLSTPALAAGPQIAPRRAEPVQADSCSAYGDQRSSSKEPVLVRKGDQLSAVLTWGCGCPTGDVFTLVYEPRADAVDVRLCVDSTKDICEMACRRDWQWDMSSILKSADTSRIAFPDAG